VFDLAYVQAENSFFEEKVYVFEIGLYIFVYQCFPIVIKVILNLYFCITEDLGITLVDNNVFIPDACSGISNCIKGIFKKIDQVPDIGFILSNLFSTDVLLGGNTGRKDRNQKEGKKKVNFTHGICS